MATTYSAQMTEITKEETEAEHRRRRLQEQPSKSVAASAHSAQCIHCGRPFAQALASAGQHGLCDDCLMAD